MEGAMVTVVYEVEALTKVYAGASDPANDAISFTIGGGEIVGLLGPNGAGKTTLVRQLAGLVRPTSGSVRLFGRDVIAEPDIVAQHVAMQPQDAAALLDLTASEAIFHTGRLRGLTRARAHQEVTDLLALLDIESSAKRLVRRLSGGERRLVSLGVTLVADRPVLILDEPTNDLDPQARKRVWDLLRKMNTDGRTVIVVTHNVLEAERILDRVGLINHGKLMALGRTADLRKQVDQRVRLEVSFAEGVDQTALAVLDGVGEELIRANDRRAVLIERERVPDLISKLALGLGLGPQGLSDIHVQGPTLEDVYLQLGGEERLG
jgi:ABC-type multidrug transport system ATPase subunit